MSKIVIELTDEGFACVRHEESDLDLENSKIISTDQLIRNLNREYKGTETGLLHKDTIAVGKDGRGTYHLVACPLKFDNVDALLKVSQGDAKCKADVYTVDNAYRPTTKYKTEFGEINTDKFRMKHSRFDLKEVGSREDLIDWIDEVQQKVKEESEKVDEKRLKIKKQRTYSEV